MKLLIDQLEQLIRLFQPHCSDPETLQELRLLLRLEKDWPKAHYLASRIRTKTINAQKRGELKLEAQYSFEEVCAQTLHNLTVSKKPFEPDTPYWIIPLALKLARELDLDTKKVIEIVMS